MADIHNNYSGATITFEAGSTQNGDVNISGGTFNQNPGAQVDEKPDIEEKNDSEEAAAQLTNRQLVMLMAGVMDLTLDAEYLNQSALARLLSAMSGRSASSLRKTINEIAAQGYDTQGARQDMLVVASLLEKLDPRLAERLRNDARET